MPAPLKVLSDRHPTDRKKMSINYNNGKSAVTHYKVLKRFRQYTHVECRLETGRTHQIRVHMAHVGHPPLGRQIVWKGRTGSDAARPRRAAQA